MSLILNIDTSEQIATVSIAENGLIFALQKNETQNKHAAFLHTAIKSLLDNLPNQKINAVAVVAGPGSYTGLRVGMSAAKGLCYALNLPLITINSLAMIGHAAVKHSTEKDAYLCPMIDARRMEVFTALYSPSLKEIIAPKAEIINEGFLNYIMNFANKVFFMGTGAIKIPTQQNIFRHQWQCFHIQIFMSANLLAWLYQSHFILRISTENKGTYFLF